MVDAEVSIRLEAPARPFVSRGGEKLAGALERFGLDVTGRRCIDVGASTGGFTDCLLQRGAASVSAVDVGYGQLAWSLVTDDRVTVVDRTNIRHADPADLGAPFDLIVADLSFISLRTVASALAALGREGSEYVLLVKPQFEVGRANVGRGGIVRDLDAVRRAVGAVLDSLEEVGIGVIAAVPSPITGAKGNQEYLIRGELGSPGDRAATLEGIQ
jgi:23S rRNA (cytidine1920-2'-O)/16S rRNA (cytidine1409-2'-O)-methyltransferase